MVAVLPRSTSIQAGSAKQEDQRVPALPSKAFAGPVPAFSSHDDVAGLPWDSRVLAARASTVVATRYPARTTNTATAAKKVRERRAGFARPRRWGVIWLS